MMVDFGVRVFDEHGVKVDTACIKGDVAIASGSAGANDIINWAVEEYAKDIGQAAKEIFAKVNQK